MALHATRYKEGRQQLIGKNERKTKDVQGQGPSNINLSLLLCFLDVSRAC